MTGTFALLFLLFTTLMVWGFVRPQHFARYAKGAVPKRRHLGIGFGVLAFASMMISGASAPQAAKPAGVQLETTSKTTQSPTAMSNSSSQPSVTAKQVTATQPIAFTITTQSDATLPKGQTKIVQPGQNGVLTLAYKVTYTNGKETGRVLISQTVTTAMVPQIVANGTYVAPPPVEHPTPQAPAPTPSGCTSGTYVNSAGNTVCSPEAVPSAPAGATAKCNDGTYSFSQSRSGTCSHHGGVAEWL